MPHPFVNVLEMFSVFQSYAASHICFIDNFLRNVFLSRYNLFNYFSSLVAEEIDEWRQRLFVYFTAFPQRFGVFPAQIYSTYIHIMKLLTNIILEKVLLTD